jgi:hypothetical protein
MVSSPAGVPQAEIVREVALFGARNRDGWGVGLTILTALANILPVLPEAEAYLALFHGARRVAADCDGEAPRAGARALGRPRPDPAALKRWLRRSDGTCAIARGGEAPCSAIAAGFSPAELAGALFAAETERAFADTGHSARASSTRRSSASTWSAAARAEASADCRRSDGSGPWRRGSTAWRQPVDLVAFVSEINQRTRGPVRCRTRLATWSRRAALAQEAAR